MFKFKEAFVMKNKSKKTIKGDNIHFRVTSLQKKQIAQKAEKIGMSISVFLLHLSEHGKINVIDDNGLTEEVYKLNYKLNQLAKYPAIPVKELQDIISQGIIDIKNKFESEEKK